MAAACSAADTAAAAATLRSLNARALSFSGLVSRRPLLVGREPTLARVPPSPAMVLYAEAAMGGAPRRPCVGMNPALTSSALSTRAYAV